MAERRRIYEWDPEKAANNVVKHGIEFADAINVFESDLSITYDDRDHSSQEDRFLILGIDRFGRYLVVAYTYRGETVRFISARKMTPRERRRFENE